jgi:hypothetical protein
MRNCGAVASAAVTPCCCIAPMQVHEDTVIQGRSPAAPQGPRCPGAPARRLFQQQQEGCGLQPACSSNMTELAQAVPQSCRACRALPGLAPATESARKELRAWLAQQESQLGAASAERRQAWCALAAL